MPTKEAKPEDWFDWAESFLAEWKARDVAAVACAAGWSRSPAPWNDAFTPQAARVLSCASAAARSLGQDYLGAEHLLAGILKVSSRTVAEALQATGLTLALLKEEIESDRGNIPASPPPTGSIPYTPRCKGIIARAMTRARGLGVRVEVDDLLLELLVEKDGLPARIFRQRAIDVEKIKNMILPEPPRP